MPQANLDHGADDVLEEQKVDSAAYAEVRRGFEEFMKINFHVCLKMPKKNTRISKRTLERG